jgi:hypothetical protein
VRHRYTPKYFAAELPSFPDLPAYDLSGYNAVQRYHLEIWCEKSTMNDVLLPLARRYGATLQIGVGELSITKTLSLVSGSIVLAGRRASSIFPTSIRLESRCPLPSRASSNT